MLPWTESAKGNASSIWNAFVKGGVLEDPRVSKSSIDKEQRTPEENRLKEQTKKERSKV